MRDFKGAFQIAREMFDSDIFFYKPDKWLKIWIFIIGICNHKKSGGFDRGETLTTYNEIAYYTKSSDDVVKHCLAYLRKADMIATHRTTRGLRIKVVKYDYFQSLDSYRGEKDDSKAEQKATPKANRSPLTSPTIVKNDNNDKNVERGGTHTFKIPDILEVKEYCKERNNAVNPQRFIDFYQSKGWMVGKNKMKDWKACIRTWEDKDKPKDSLKVNTGKYDNIKKTIINN